MVAQDESDDEEDNSQEHGHSSDDVDEVMDFLGNRGFSRGESRGESSNTAHNSIVSAANHDSSAGSCSRTDHLLFRPTDRQQDRKVQPNYIIYNSHCQQAKFCPPTKIFCLESFLEREKLPSTALVEKKAKFRVSRGFS